MWLCNWNGKRNLMNITWPCLSSVFTKNIFLFLQVDLDQKGFMRSESKEKRTRLNVSLLCFSYIWSYILHKCRIATTWGYNLEIICLSTFLLLTTENLTGRSLFMFTVELLNLELGPKNVWKVEVAKEIFWCSSVLKLRSKAKKCNRKWHIEFFIGFWESVYLTTHVSETHGQRYSMKTTCNNAVTWKYLIYISY